MFARVTFIYSFLVLLVLSCEGGNEPAEKCCDSLLIDIVYLPAKGSDVTIERDISLLSIVPICSISVSGMDNVECRGDITDGGVGQNSMAVKIYGEPGDSLRCRVDVYGYCE